MKKVVLAMLAFSVVATGALAACNNTKQEHEHVWSWASDASQHWKACSGCEEKESLSEHFYKAQTDGTDAWGACDCGAQAELLPTMVDYAVKYKDLVKSGTTTFVSGTEGNWNTDYAETSNYQFRNGYFFVENSYMGEIQSTKYYMQKEDGAPYSVAVVRGDDGKNIVQHNNEEYSLNNMRGYLFNSIIFGSDERFYGADELVSILYDYAIEDKNEDLVESYKIVDGKVYGAFDFGYLKGPDGYFFRLSVEMSMSEKGYLESATIYSYKYTTNQFKVEDGIATPKTNAEYDAEYGAPATDAEGEDGEDGEDGEVQVRDPNAEVTPFYNWKITLTQSDVCEEENTPNPYDPAQVLFSSVDFVYADGTAIPDTITMEAMTKQIFYIENLLPTTAIPALNPEVHTIDGKVADFFDIHLMIYYNKSSNYVNVNAQQEIGSYEVVFSFGALSKTFTINVILATPTELTPSVSDGQTFTPATTAKTYAGMNLSFKAVAPAAYYDTSVTATVLGANAANATITWNEELGEYVFNATEVGTYEIQMVSTKDTNVVTNLTVTVEELPDVASLLSGSYRYERTIAGKTKVDYIVTFEPSAVGALNGTVMVERVGTGTDVFSYTYDPANGFRTTWIAGAETGVTIAMGSAFNLYVERNGTQYPLAGLELGGEEENTDETADYAMYESFKTYSGVYENGMSLGGTWYSNAKVVFAPNHPTDKNATTLTGTIEFTAGQDSFTGTATYSFSVSGGLVINLENNKWVNDDIEYAVSINSDEMIVITRTSTDSSATWQLTQMNTEPDAYKNGTKEELSSGSGSGAAGDSLQGSGTMFDPYVLIDEADVVLNLSGSAAHGVFMYTATNDGYLTFANAENATIFLADNVNGILSPAGDPLDVSESAGPNHVAVTAGEIYYFMVYSAGNDAAVSFTFWVINA